MKDEVWLLDDDDNRLINVSDPRHRLRADMVNKTAREEGWTREETHAFLRQLLAIEELEKNGKVHQITEKS